MVDGDAPYRPETIAVGVGMLIVLLVVLPHVMVMRLGVGGIQEQPRRSGIGFRRSGTGQGELEGGFKVGGGTDLVGAEVVAPEGRHLLLLVVGSF